MTCAEVPDTGVKAIINSNQNDLVHLADVVPGAPTKLLTGVFTVITSPPKKSNYEQFWKVPMLKLWMPVWSLDEVKSVARLQLGDLRSEGEGKYAMLYFIFIVVAVAHSRFLKVGGVLRKLVLRDKLFEQYVQQVDAAIKGYDVQALYKLQNEDDGYGENESHKLIAIGPESLKKLHVVKKFIISDYVKETLQNYG